MVIENTARKAPRPAAIAGKPRRKKEPARLALIDQNLCTGCEACLAFCPVDCLETVSGVESALFGQSIEVDVERCTGCDLCWRHCPWDAIRNFDYAEGIWRAPAMTLKSVCQQKCRTDLKDSESKPAT